MHINAEMEWIGICIWVDEMINDANYPIKTAPGKGDRQFSNGLNFL